MVDDILHSAHETAQDAGENAADRLAEIVSDEAVMLDTAIRFVHSDRLADDFMFENPHTTISHRVNADTHRDAHSVLLFPTEIEEEIVGEYSLTDAETGIDPHEYAESKLTEVGHTISNALIDAWGESSPNELQIEAPSRESGVYPETLLPEDIRWLDAVIPVFETRFSAGNHEFTHFLIPAADVHLHNLVGRTETDVSDFPRAVESVVAHGAEEVSERLNAQFTDTAIDVVDWSLRYTTPDSIPEYFPSNRAQGSGFSLDGYLTGSAYVGFDAELAATLASDLRGRIESTDENDNVTEDIIEEVSLNVLAAFGDGWANISHGEVDYTLPEYIEDDYDEAIETLADTVNADYTFAFTARLADVDDLERDCRLVVMSDSTGIAETAQDLEDLFSELRSGTPS